MRALLLTGLLLLGACGDNEAPVGPDAHLEPGWSCGMDQVNDRACVVSSKRPNVDHAYRCTDGSEPDLHITELSCRPLADVDGTWCCSVTSDAGN